MHIVILGARSSIHVVRWANAMAERGHRVDLLTMHREVEPVSGLVKIIRLPFANPPGYLLNIPFVRKTIRQLQPDLVHSFYAFGHSFMGRMACNGCPHLVSVMGSDVYDAPRKNFLYRRLIIKNILTADRTASTSHTMARHIQKLCGQPVMPEVTPFGVDTGQFKPVPGPREEGVDFVVGTVKTMMPKYGVDVLIRAFDLFRKQHPGKTFRLMLAGEGEMTKELKQLAARLGLEDSCTFTGRIPHRDVPQYLNQMDVFAALSRYDSESFGVAVLEASACGLPVVVSDAGGLPEVVFHNKTGIVVPRVDPRAAAEALSRLYKDRALARRLGQNGRRRVSTLYRWDHNVDQMEKLYREVARDWSDEETERNKASFKSPRVCRGP